MASTTSLLGLVKPTSSEDQDIDIINANMDKVEQGVKGKLTHPYAIMRKTDGFGTQFANNVQDSLVGWTGSNTEYIDLQASTGALALPYSNGTFTIPINGVYHIECGIAWALRGDSFDAAGSRRLSAYQSRSAGWIEIVRDQKPGQASLTSRNYISKIARFAAGDFLKFDVAQSSGVALSLDATGSGVNIFASIVCLTRLD